MNEYSEDFTLWARECVRIADKLTGQSVPFELNAPQRRVLAILEDMRRRRRPIRMIMLKARQWGGSTLVQTYMAWMQLVRHTGWNSLICAHVRDASSQIRGMYSRMLREYPARLKAAEGPREWQFVPYERSQSVCWVPARDAQVAIATSLSPNSLRGSSFAMAHLSEVAFWADGDEKAAEEIVRTVSGSVPLAEDTLIVMESTANGTSNYFHSEWQRAVAGKSDKTPVFVPWHEIEIYRRPVREREREQLLASLDEYELALFRKGVGLEALAWYHQKRREYPTHEAMMAEFPSTPEEAFAVSGTDALLHTLPGSDAITDAARSLDPEPDSRFAVLLVAGDLQQQLLTLFGRYGDMITPLSDTSLDGCSLSSALDRAAQLCRRYGSVPLRIVEVPSGTALPVHARWCASRAERLGLPLLYDEDERAYSALDTPNLLHLADEYAMMAEKGLIFETSGEARQQLAVCSLTRPRATPLALTRLASLL